MVSRRSDLYLSALLPTARGAIATADDDSDDEVEAWIWRNSRTAASFGVATNGLPAAPLPLLGRAAAARDTAADAGDRAEISGAGTTAQGGGRVARAIVARAEEAITARVARRTSARVARRTSGGTGALLVCTSNESVGASKVESRESTVATKTTAVEREDGTDDNQLEAEAVRRGKLATPEPSIAANKKRKDDVCHESPSGGVRAAKRARGVPKDKEELAGSLKPTNKCVAVFNGAAAINETSPDGKAGGCKTCSHDDCTTMSVQGGVCFKHGAKRKSCSHDGCTTQAVKAGVCYKHGAKRKTCSHDDCTNTAKQGGVCNKHGAKRKTCSRDGCTKNAVKGGVCYKHGAKRNTCSRDGCTTYATKGGVCHRHGGQGKTCSRDGCTTFAIRGGVCRKHGAKGETCSRDGCTNGVVKGGVCHKHRTTRTVAVTGVRRVPKKKASARSTGRG